MNVPLVAEPRRQLALEPVGADDVGVGLAQRFQCLSQEAIAHAFAPAVRWRTQHHDRHQVVHRHDDRPAARLLDHVRVAVIEHVHDVGALRFALHAPRIEVVAGRIRLRAVQRTGQHHARRIDGLRPPAHERFAPVAALLARRAAATNGVARQRTDVSGQIDTEPEIARLQPVMETMSVAVHGRPTL